MMNSEYVTSITYGCGDGHREVEVFPRLRNRMLREKQSLLFIPKSDEARFRFLQPGVDDPAPGVKKVLTVNHAVDLDDSEVVFLVLLNDAEDSPMVVGTWNDFTVKAKLAQIHQSLRLQHGLMDEEVPEQLILCSFLPLILHKYAGESLDILEIGGNMGRATMVTRRVLTSLFGVQESRPVIRHAVMETFPSIAAQLRDNLSLNQMAHEIEVIESTLNDEARFGLIQTNWNITSFRLSDEFEKFQFQKSLVATRDGNNRAYRSSVKSIAFQPLCETYFGGQCPTVWIVDCEGFFFNIVTQFPECLRALQLLVIENDFASLEDKKTVDEALRRNGLYDLVTFPGGLPQHACRQSFYQVWIRSGSEFEKTMYCNIRQTYLREKDDLFPEFEPIRLSGPEFSTDSKVSTTRSLEKKQNSTAITTTNMKEEDFAELQAAQEVDFLCLSSAHRDHEFLVYSIVGCTNCDNLMDEASVLLQEVTDAMEENSSCAVSVRVRKVDVTNFVRNNPQGKEAFLKFLKDRFGYSSGSGSGAALKPHEQRMYFPIVIYNEKYLGGADSAKKKMSKVVFEILDQLD